MGKYKKLQNGSDIRGIAITGVPGESPNLTADEAADIARGFLAWLCGRLNKKPEDMKLAVGRDSRVSGQHLMDGLMNGFGPYGCKVFDCGLASTPAMFMATVFPEFQCDGTVMITASHLPYNRNGFKFFTREGGLDKKDIADILNYAEHEDICREKIGAPSNKDGFIHRLGKRVFPMEKAGLMELYCGHLRKLIIDGTGKGQRPLEGMKIVVDAGNGSGGFFATEVLKPLGANTKDSQFLEPDGMFLNHAPNPEDREAMNSISMQVVSKGADLGIIFDTDVDRSAAVDSRGREIARNGIVAMAAALVAESHPGSTVVTDSITSRQLTEFLEKKLKLKHFRFKRGYKNVINKGVELNEQGIDCQLAIETSGHAALKENYFLDDGAYMIVKVLIEAYLLLNEGKEVSALIDSLKEPKEATEIRGKFLVEEFKPYGAKVLEDFKAFAEATEGWELEIPNYEGVRVNCDENNGNGWVLVRLSLHDPQMPINIESDSIGGVEKIKEKVLGFLSGYEIEF